MQASAVEFLNVTKSFGTVVANRNCSFRITQGTIHGVVGENGAGKSTILKALYGMHAIDSGQILIDGVVTRIQSPEHAIRLGIGMVHQHFMLVPTLKVWENIVLGNEPSLGFTNRKKSLERLRELVASYGFKIDLETTVESLPVGLQQQVEILKLLYRNARILVLDEPTAVLTPQEVDALLNRLTRLRQGGKTVVFISHKLREILQFTQNLTVLRRGEVVLNAETGSIDENRLAEAIVGRQTGGLPEVAVSLGAENVFELRELRTERKVGHHALNGLSLHVKRGEIVGIAGVEGNGQQALSEILAGVRNQYDGKALCRGADLRTLPPRGRIETGIAVIPPDRHREGLVLDFSVAENYILGQHCEPHFHSRRGLLDWKKVHAATRTSCESFSVRPADSNLPIRALSGGNQQKVIVARALSNPVHALLAVHPTRGIDIGAAHAIHRRFLDLKAQGAGILLISSEIEEILALSDRVLVLFDGRIQGELSRKEAEAPDADRRLGLWMTGGNATEASA